MTLSRDDVRHVAMLARLGLELEEEDFYVQQLGGIMQHIDRLREVDTGAIPPTAQAVPQTLRLREDEPAGGLSQEEALAGAPESRAGFFVVKAIQEPEP